MQNGMEPTHANHLQRFDESQFSQQRRLHPEHVGRCCSAQRVYQQADKPSHPRSVTRHIGVNPNLAVDHLDLQYTGVWHSCTRFSPASFRAR